MYRVIDHTVALPGLYLRQELSRQRIREFQSLCLRRLIRHAYENVPYYRRLFDRNGVDSRDIRSPSDLTAIPVTTKSDLRDVPVRDTLARGVNPKQLVSIDTSGSTGEPFIIRRTRLERRLQDSYWLRAMFYFGLRLRDRIASIIFVRPGYSESGGVHRRLLKAIGIGRKLRIHCCERREEIVRVLRQWRPQFLGGYAGTLAYIAEALSERDRKDMEIRVVWSGAEVLTQQMRERISAAFGARVYNIYGSHELHLIAWECKQTGEFHTCDDNLIVEVLKDGQPVAPGESGELVGTVLHSFAMPFIRYRLGDVVTKGSEVCACGEPFSTLRDVQGRIIDYFPLADGRVLHPYQIVGVVLDTAQWIRRYQLVQERKDLVTLRVVPLVEPSRDELQRLQKAVAPVLGPAVAFRVSLVPEIGMGTGGKFRVSCSLVAPHEHRSDEARPPANRLAPGVIY